MLDSEDSDVDEHGPGAKHRHNAKINREGKTRFRDDLKRTRSDRVDLAEQAPTQKEAAHLFFGCGEFPTKIYTKTRVNLDVRAAAERDGKLVMTSGTRWVHTGTGLVTQGKPPADDTGEPRMLKGCSLVDRISFVCKDGACSFHQEFRWKRIGMAFFCNACDPHTCKAADSSGKRTRFAAHAFEAKDLVPSIRAEVAAQSEKISMKLVKLFLGPFLATQPTDKFCHKVFSLAVKGLAPKNSIGHLQACLSELEESCGYKTDLRTATPDEQKKFFCRKQRPHTCACRAHATF